MYTQEPLVALWCCDSSCRWSSAGRSQGVSRSLALCSGLPSCQHIQGPYACKSPLGLWNSSLFCMLVISLCCITSRRKLFHGGPARRESSSVNDGKVRALAHRAWALSWGKHTLDGCCYLADVGREKMYAKHPSLPATPISECWTERCLMKWSAGEAQLPRKTLNLRDQNRCSL